MKITDAMVTRALKAFNEANNPTDEDDMKEALQAAFDLPDDEVWGGTGLDPNLAAAVADLRVAAASSDHRNPISSIVKVLGHIIEYLKEDGYDA